MEMFLSLIIITAIIAGTFGYLTITSALAHGGEFYIGTFYGRRKMWIEKLLDGLEILREI